MKMDNKGFTLIELIVVIALLATMTGLFTINALRESRLSDEKKKEEIYNEIIAASDAYVFINENDSQIKSLLRGTSSYTVSIDTLKKSGLLNSNFNTEYTYVVISKNSNGNLDFELGK